MLQRFGALKSSDLAQAGRTRTCGGWGQTGPAGGRRTPTLHTGADSHADEPLAKGRSRAGARTTSTATNSETRGGYFDATLPSNELAAPPLVRKENFKIYRLTGYKLAAAGAYRYLY